jgi:hypothetical protein
MVAERESGDQSAPLEKHGWFAEPHGESADCEHLRRFPSHHVALEEPFVFNSLATWQNPLRPALRQEQTLQLLDSTLRQLSSWATAEGLYVRYPENHVTIQGPTMKEEEVRKK